jgi:hydroxymethylpyrimidine/phosphomethylpyrimidine kinase
LNQRNTHGSGCTFSAALATLLSQGSTMKEAVSGAKRFITDAIAEGLDIGSGHGPTNPYAHVHRLRERQTITDELKRALNLLTRKEIGRLIPEVRSNFGYAIAGASSFQEVAGFPGRISQIGDRIVVYKEPEFGASKHIARVILAAMQHAPELRSAMNIRYNSDILAACSASGLSVASFDRSSEPREVKEREGSTLEWGTHNALRKQSQLPDVIYDTGEVGKEPMIRVLGTNPAAVAEKIIRIYEHSGH